MTLVGYGILNVDDDWVSGDYLDQEKAISEAKRFDEEAIAEGDWTREENDTEGHHVVAVHYLTIWPVPKEGK